jgi:hypothetical protein
MQSSFRFPFVALQAGRRKALLWGRLPFGIPGLVKIQWRQGLNWNPLTVLRSDGDGIFTATRPLPSRADPKYALLRAVGNGETSPSFSLHHPPDISVTPFGS